MCRFFGVSETATSYEKIEGLFVEAGLPDGPVAGREAKAARHIGRALRRGQRFVCREWRLRHSDISGPTWASASMANSGNPYERIEWILYKIHEKIKK